VGGRTGSVTGGCSEERWAGERAGPPLAPHGPGHDPSPFPPCWLLGGLKREGESPGRDRPDPAWCGQGARWLSLAPEGFLQLINGSALPPQTALGGPCATCGQGHGQGAAAGELPDVSCRSPGMVALSWRASRQGKEPSPPGGAMEGPGGAMEWLEGAMV